MRSLSRLATIILFVLTLPLVGWAQSYVEGEVIVKLKGTGSRTRSLGFSSKVTGRGMKIQRAWTSQNLHQMKAMRSQSTQELIDTLKADPEVEYVEPNYIVSKGDFEEISQQEAGAQSVSFSGMMSFVSGLGLTTAAIKAVDAWTQVSGAALPIVAVIDTGIDKRHQALSAAVWVNTREIPDNGIDDDGNGYVDDVNGWNFVDGNNNVQDCYGHGTHVSGIVRGTTQFIFDNNNMPAPIVKIMPVKFLDCYGSGTTAGAIAAIYYAVGNGAKVLNNSWGGGGYSRALHEAILYSYNSKTVFVAAAGNSRANIDVSKTYPASYPVPNVISVLATRSDDSAATEFTNYGVASVPVGAPGSGIWSAYPDFWGDPWCDDDGNPATYEGCFRSMSGTSMAAPFVSAIAALMANERPTMTGYQIKQLIMANADRKSGLVNYVSTSSRVNSLSSVVASKAATLDPNQPYYEIGFSDEERGLASAIASSGAGGCGMVRALSDGGAGGGGDTPYGLLGLLTGLMVLPLFLAAQLKRKSPAYKREFTRYQIQSKVRVRTAQGDEHEVDLSTLSIGGAGFKSDMDLSLGSQLSFKLQAPSGEWMEVKGHVVWAGEGHTHGVKFDDQLSPNLVMALVRG